MIRKHPILLSFLILIIAGISWAVWRAKQPKPTPIRVAKAVKMDKLVQQATASGEIRTHDMVDIQTEIPGIIIELPVKEGQRIKKGDLLLRIDPFQTQMTLASNQGRYAVAQGQVNSAASEIENKTADLGRLRQMLKSCESDLVQAQITAERSKSSFDRYDALFKTNVISRDEFEDFEMRLRLADKRVDNCTAAIEQTKAQIRSAELGIEKCRIEKKSAENNLSIADAALKQAQDQLEKTNIRSPLDGVIVKLNVNVGERAVPGNQFDTKATLMTLADMDVIEAELKVYETDIVRLKLGQEVKVKVDALQTGAIEEVFLPAKVTEIASAPNQTQGSNSSSSSSNQQEGRDFKVIATLENPPPELRIGMLCEAKITNATRNKLLAIPIQALTTREVELDKDGRYVMPPKPDPKSKPGGGISQTAIAANSATTETKQAAKKELQGVFVKGPDGYAHFRPITTGLMDETNVEVTDGLKLDEEVIIGPLQSLRVLEEWTLVKLEETPAGAQGTK